MGLFSLVPSGMVSIFIMTSLTLFSGRFKALSYLIPGLSGLFLGDLASLGNGEAMADGGLGFYLSFFIYLSSLLSKPSDEFFFMISRSIWDLPLLETYLDIYLLLKGEPFLE